MPNLRVIHNNVVDLSTTNVTVSTTASGTTTAANLKKDAKSSIWRSASTSTSTAPKANLVVSFNSVSTVIGAVILPFCNLSPTATMLVRGWTGTTPTVGGTADTPTITTTGATQVFTTGTVSCCPYTFIGAWNWDSSPGANAFAYGGRSYARVWLTTPVACTSVSIEISDPGNSGIGKYIEATRLIVGNYWSPVYNTGYGLSTTVKDLSTHQRTESGDMITNRSVRYNALNFDLNWLTAADRLVFSTIVRGGGLARPLFISLFPDNSTDWEKENAHQIYGKLTQLSAVQNSILDLYSTQIEIEEI